MTAQWRLEILTGADLEFARVGLEAGELPVVLFETRQLRAVKTDRTEARSMAQLVRTGWFRALHVESELSHKLLVGKLRDIDIGIGGLLCSFGLNVGAVGKCAVPSRVRELAMDGKSPAVVIKFLLQVREMLRTCCAPEQAAGGRLGLAGW